MPIGWSVTATATDADGNTSEFGQNLTVLAAPAAAPAHAVAQVASTSPIVAASDAVMETGLFLGPDESALNDLANVVAEGHGKSTRAVR